MTLVIIASICAALVILRVAVPRRALMASGRKGGTAVSEDRPEVLRVATYNIHGGKGSDGRRELTRTAMDLEHVDVVSVQEVRSGWKENQAEELGRELALNWLYTPTLRRWFRNYRGNGLLSRFDIVDWRSYPLPNVAGHRYRIYTVAKIVVGGSTIRVLFTHLHTGQGRHQQLRIVWDQFLQLPTPAVLLGDLNTRPSDPALEDILSADGDDPAARTVVIRAHQVDWIFVRGLEIVDSGYSDSGASDHPCYWADVQVKATRSGVQAESFAVKRSAESRNQ